MSDVLTCTLLHYGAHSLPVSQQVNISASPIRPQESRLFLRDEELERGVGLILAAERRLCTAARKAREMAGLNPSAFQTLMAIRAEPGLSVKALREQLGATVPTLARILGDLDKRNLVERPRALSDGRKRQLVLTPEGAAVTEPAADAMRDALRDAYKQAGAEQVAGAVIFLEALKDG